MVTYGVTIFLDQSNKELKPDMTASVTIQTGRRADVLLISAVAVQVGVNGSTVKTLKKVDGVTRVTTTKVKTGGSDGVNVEILFGLTEGQEIVLAGGNSAPERPGGAGPSSPFGSGGGGGGMGRGGGGGRTGG